MFKYTKIPETTFENIGLNAGILLDNFDPTNPLDESAIQEHLIGATTGGITVDVTPTYSDLGEDIDNCPKNTMELKHLDSWAVTVSGTFVTMSKDSLKLQLGAAAEADSNGVITLRNYVQDSDFQDLWWVGDYNQGTGFIGVHISNALSTGGIKLKSTDQAKLTADFEFTGHYSIKDQDTVPVEFFLLETEDTATTASVKPTETETESESTTNGTEAEG